MSSIIRADRWQNSNGVAYNSVLQVVQTVKTDVFTTSSTTYVDITGLSVSITPFLSTSKILVLVDVKHSGGADGFNTGVRLLRGSTEIYVGNTAGSRTASMSGGNGVNSGVIFPATGIFLDSPNTTSATTYKVQVVAKPSGGSYTAAINASVADGDVAYNYRTASSITVMEIAQ